MNTYWQKQTKDYPLFPDMMWSRPENKRLAGKLLIIGGNLHAANAPSSAYNQAIKSGIGVAKVVLPDALRKTFGSILENCEFAPSTPSGSFAKASLALWLEQAVWSDAVLIAGDMGRNSETAVLVESFVTKYKGPLTLTQDALDFFVKTPHIVLNRPKTLLVGSFDQIQKLMTVVPCEQGVMKHSNILGKNIEILSAGSTKIQSYLVTKQIDQMLTVLKGQASTTPNTEEIWRVNTAASASVWWLQNPQKSFEAITTSLIA